MVRLIKDTKIGLNVHCPIHNIFVCRTLTVV